LTDIAKDTITEDTETEFETSNVNPTEPAVQTEDPTQQGPITNTVTTAQVIVQETFESLPETEKRSEMIIINNGSESDVALDDKNVDSFSKKLVLIEHDDDGMDRERINKNLSLNDFEEEFEAKQDPDFATVVNKRGSMVDKNNSVIDLDKSNFKTPITDNSFKLITEDSMLLDESALMPVKTDTININKNTNKPSTKNSSSEDLSSSSVCVSSASNQEMAKLIIEINELKERERTHLQRIDSLEEENEKFKTVAIDFEEIFKNLIMDKEENEVKLKNEIIELTKERDQLQEDVIGVERAFDDLHRRFEKLKTKVEEFKKVGFR